MSEYYLYKESDSPRTLGFAFHRTSLIEKEDNIEEVYNKARGRLYSSEIDFNPLGDGSQFIYFDDREINLNGFGEVTEEEFKRWIAKVEQETGLSYDDLKVKGKCYYVE